MVKRHNVRGHYRVKNGKKYYVKLYIRGTGISEARKS